MSGSRATTGGGGGGGVEHHPSKGFLAKRLKKSQPSAEKFKEPCGERWLSNFLSPIEFAVTKLPSKAPCVKLAKAQAKRWELTVTPGARFKTTGGHGARPDPGSNAHYQSPSPLETLRSSSVKGDRSNLPRGLQRVRDHV